MSVLEFLYEDQTIPLKSIEVRNLGPVERAKIEVKPLTILVGRNSSGKSIISRMIYYLWGYRNNLEQFIAILDSLEVEDEILEVEESTEFDLSRERRIPKKFADFFAGIIDQVGSERKIDSSYLNEVFNLALNKFIGSFILREKIKEEEIENLIKAGTSKAYVTIDEDCPIDIVNDELYGLDIKDKFISDFPKFQEVSNRFVLIFRPTPFEKETYYIDKQKAQERNSLIISLFNLILELIVRTFMKFENLLKDRGHYVPDTRGGIMLRMDKIIQERLRRPSLSIPSIFEIKEEIDRTNTYHTDQLSLLEFLLGNMNLREDPYATHLERKLIATIIKRPKKLPGWKRDILKFFGDHLLEGKIRSGEVTDKITYLRKDGYEFDLHRVSSLISNLTPLWLLIERGLEKGDLLVFYFLYSLLHPAAHS